MFIYLLLCIANEVRKNSSQERKEKSLSSYIIVLVLAGLELIFFLTAGTVRCFGFKLKITLTTHHCFSCWAVLTLSHRVFCFLCFPAKWGSWGCTRSWEGTEAGQLMQTDQTDVPHCMTLWSAIKPWGIGQGRKGCHCSGTGWASVHWWWAIIFCITCFFLVFLFVCCCLVMVFLSFFSSSPHRPDIRHVVLSCLLG